MEYQIYEPACQILDAEYQIDEPACQILNAEYQIYEPACQILDAEYQIYEPACQILNAEYQIDKFASYVFKTDQRFGISSLPIWKSINEITSFKIRFSFPINKTACPLEANYILIKFDPNRMIVLLTITKCHIQLLSEK